MRLEQALILFFLIAGSLPRTSSAGALTVITCKSFEREELDASADGNFFFGGYDNYVFERCYANGERIYGADPVVSVRRSLLRVTNPVTFEKMTEKLVDAFSDDSPVIRNLGYKLDKIESKINALTMICAGELDGYKPRGYGSVTYFGHAVRLRLKMNNGSICVGGFRKASNSYGFSRGGIILY